MRRRYLIQDSKNNNIIYYTTIDNNTINVPMGAFNVIVLSNVYNEMGIITCKGSIKAINNYAFHNCSSLTSIEIPNSVTRIGHNAFSGCTKLTNIEIPNSVISIGDSAFNSCSNLSSIEIPNSIISIGDGAFSHCDSLTSIEIPNSVTSIGSNMFNSCSSLASIEIPNSVTSIGVYAFYWCTSLASIEIPNSVTSIGDRAFYHCSNFTSIEIPNSVTSIGKRAFADCTRLASVYIKSITPPTLGDNVFRNSNRKIYVPRASLNAYKTASGWSNYADAIEPYDFDGSVNEITFYIEDPVYVTPMKALPNMTWGDFINSEYANQNSIYTNFILFDMGSYNSIKFYHGEGMYDMTLYDDLLHSQNTSDSDIIEDGKTYYAY